uniref:G_PROTEIN_RECEP_F1_2 domain-containing protein n=1 Tax=Panagrellus redivivus TaxID=6233 RepID=A0A7E4V7C1_PANRE
MTVHTTTIRIDCSMLEQHSFSSAPYIHPYFASRVELIPLGIFSVLLGFFVDYVIVTRSSALGTYKYYLLNQTIWAQMLEIFMLVFNPVFLSPHIAGYMSGFLQNIGSYECTVAAATLCFLLYINTVAGITLSLINRYIFTFFPQHRKLLENKYTLMGLALFHIVFYILDILIFVSLATDSETIRIYAKNETAGGLDSFYAEPSLIYVSEYGGKTRLLCQYIFGVLVILVTILTASVSIFVLNVVIKRKKTSIATLTAKSLVLSSIVQAVLCIVMVYTPMLLVMFAWGYNAPNSANIKLSEFREKSKDVSIIQGQGDAHFYVESGIFRDRGSYGFTVVATTLSLIIYVNAVIGIALSLINRYVFTFIPAKKKYFDNKYTLFLIFLLHISLYIVIIVILAFTATDATTIRSYAKSETGTALLEYFNEQTFIYVSEFGTRTRSICQSASAAFVIFIFSSLMGIIWFTISVTLYRKKPSIISKTSKSLIIAAIVQTLLCAFMLYTPMFVVVFTSGFNIQGSTNVVNAFMILISYHGTVDMLCTLYFVVPYRNYCLRLFRIVRKRMSSSVVSESVFS